MRLYSQKTRRNLSLVSIGTVLGLLFCLGLVGTVLAQESIIIKNNTGGKTIIQRVSTQKDMNSDFMLISSKGTVLVGDGYKLPGDLSLKPDLITATHYHYDHIDQDFIDKNDCKKSISTVESFAVKDIKVTSIASSHSNDYINEKRPTNVIYLFEVDGLRIAHLGDIGQTQLTEDQLKVLGTIDIAFMQFDNMFSNYSLNNGKGFKLIEQLKPTIIIPTHSSAATTKKIGEIVGTLETVNNALITSKDDLKDGKRKVIDLKNTL